MKDTPAACAKTMIAALMVMTLGAWPLRAFGRECLRYEVTAIIPGPYCSGWGYSPVLARALSNHQTPWATGIYFECVVGPDKAFIWAGAGEVEPLVFPGAGPNTYAYDVTDSGWVVGAFAPAGAVDWRGFIYDVASGAITQLNPAVSNGGCIARAANNHGMVVGSRTISSTAYNAFVYQDGKYVDLGVMNGPHSEARDISTNGIIVGWTGSSSSLSTTRAFLHVDGRTEVFGPAPGSISSSASAVNDRGDCVGYGLTATQWGNVSRGFVRWADGTFVQLGTLPNYRQSFASDISDNQIIVGEARGENSSAAVIWRNGEIQNLNELLISNPGVVLSAAVSINEKRQILCYASAIPYGEVAIVLSPSPAPVADITGDCKVNVSDLLLVINEWGRSKSVADINMDGIVNVHDLLLVIKHWDTS